MSSPYIGDIINHKSIIMNLFRLDGIILLINGFAAAFTSRGSWDDMQMA